MSLESMIALGTALGIVKKLAVFAFLIFFILLIFKSGRSKTFIRMIVVMCILGFSAWSEEQIAKRVFDTGYMYGVDHDYYNESNIKKNEDNKDEAAAVTYTDEEVNSESTPESENVIASESCSGEPTYDLYEILTSSDFYTDISNGKLEPIEFGTGSSLQNIKTQWGEPVTEGNYRHLTDYHSYCSVTFFTNTEADLYDNAPSDPDQIMGLLLSVNGILVDEVREILGSPVMEYDGQVETGYYMNYLYGEVSLDLIDKDFDGRIDEVYVLDKFEEEVVYETDEEESFISEENQTESLEVEEVTEVVEVVESEEDYEQESTEEVIEYEEAGDSIYTEKSVEDLKYLINSGEKLTVYFHSPTCSFCLEAEPLLSEQAEILNIPMISIDTELYPEAWADFGLTSIPTVISFEQGSAVDGIMGLATADDYYDFLYRQ